MSRSAISTFFANPMTSGDFDGLPQERKDAALATARELVQRFEDRKKGYVKGSSAAAWAIARQHARILAQYVASRVNDPDRSARSRFMAENIRWILEHEGAGTRMVAWAHNNHVANDGASMGAHLRKALGREMVIFGFAFNEGAFQAIQPGEGLRSFTVPPAPEYTFDAMIACAKKPVAMIDFRALAAESAPAKWLREPRVTRDIGGTYHDADKEKTLVPRKLADRYDILLFVERTSAARANPEARVVSKIPRFPSPANAGFEEANEDATPRDWIVLPPIPQKFDFEMLAVEKEPHSGKRAGLIRRKPGRHYGEASGSLLQWVDAKAYREKDVRVRLAARKRQEGARMFYWMKVWGAFEERHEVASSEWQTYEIVRAIPPNAVVIEYGIALTGDGEAWVDDVELEVVEKTAAPPGDQN